MEEQEVYYIKAERLKDVKEIGEGQISGYCNRRQRLRALWAYNNGSAFCERESMRIVHSQNSDSMKFRGEGWRAYKVSLERSSSGSMNYVMAH